MSDYKKPLLAAIVSVILITSGCAADIRNAQDAAPTQDTSDTLGQSAALNEEETDGDDEAWKSNTGTISLDGGIKYTGEGISVSGSTVVISKGGNFTVSGTLENGMIYVDTGEKVKLRLNGASISNSSGPAIFFMNSKKSFISLSEGSENYLTDGSSCNVDAKAALFSNDTLEIKGAGKLTVTGNYKHAVASDDDVIIEEGTLVLSSVNNGIKANDNITISGGSIEIESSNDGINCEGDIIINGGVLNIAAADDGIHADTDLTVNGGEITISESTEGLEGKGSLTVNGGTVRVKSFDDGLNAGALIALNDGYIYLDAGGDGADSNGNLTINGGTLIAYAGNNANGPLDTADRGGIFTINGGTVIAAGGSMSISVSEDSSQYSLWIGQPMSAGTTVSVASGDGTEAAAFELPKSASLIYVSTPSLASGETYTVTAGGQHTGQAADGIYSGGSYSGGSAVGSAAMSSKSAAVGSMGGGFGGGGFGGGARPGGRTGGTGGRR